MGLFLTFYSKLDWGPYIISTAKTVSKKIGALILSVKFLSPEIALYLYKSTTICSCKEYCCHTWAGAPSCYLELLDKLQRQICRTVGPSLAPSLEPLAHCRNVASLSLFWGGTPPSEGVCRQSLLKNFFRLCIALDWFKIRIKWQHIILFFSWTLNMLLNISS